VHDALHVPCACTCASVHLVTVQMQQAVDSLQRRLENGFRKQIAEHAARNAYQGHSRPSPIHTNKGGTGLRARRRERNTNKAVGLEIDRDLWAAVGALAQSEGVSIASVVTAALLDALRAHMQETTQ
jgi:hypothetical protein